LSQRLKFIAAITWFQLGIHNKPVGILNVNGYYNPLLQQFQNGIDESLISERMGKILVVESDPVKLIEKLLTHQLQSEYKWLTEDQI
jgi:predicted Rossmann-fold nucleotide-binding protein